MNIFMLFFNCLIIFYSLKLIKRATYSDSDGNSAIWCYKIVPIDSSLQRDGSGVELLAKVVKHRGRSTDNKCIHIPWGIGWKTNHQLKNNVLDIETWYF